MQLFVSRSHLYCCLCPPVAFFFLPIWSFLSSVFFITSWWYLLGPSLLADLFSPLRLPSSHSCLIHSCLSSSSHLFPALWYSLSCNFYLLGLPLVPFSSSHHSSLSLYIPSILALFLRCLTMLLTAVFSPLFVFASSLFLSPFAPFVFLSFSAHLSPFFFFFYLFFHISVVFSCAPILYSHLLYTSYPVDFSSIFFVFTSFLPVTITSSCFGFEVKKRFSRVESLAAHASFACRLKDAPFISDGLISFYVICAGNYFLAFV